MNSNFRADKSPRHAGGRRAGFSLLELLAVLLLLGFLAGVSTPALGRFLDGLDFRKQVGEVTATLRYARLIAVTKGGQVRLALADDAVGALRLSGAVEELRPLELGEEDQLVLDPEEIVFSPEGRATPGFLIFSRGERSQKISLDPLTALPLLDPS